MLRHSTAHVLAQAVLRLWPGPTTPSVRSSRTASTTTSSSRAGPTSATTTSSDRGHHARDHGRGPAVHPARAHHRRGPGALRRSTLQAGDHPGGGAGHDEVDAGRPTARAGARQWCPPTGTPTPSPTCAGAPRPVDQAARPLRPDAGGRCLLAWRREAPAAPAHLRHRLGVGQGTGRAPPPTGGGRAARPSQARCRAGPLLVPRGDRLRACGVPSQGRHRSVG